MQWQHIAIHLMQRIEETSKMVFPVINSGKHQFVFVRDEERQKN